MTMRHNPPMPAFFFSFTPNPSPKKPKKLKANTLFFFFSTNSWYIDTYPKNLILEAMQVLLRATTLFFCCYRRVAAFGSQDLGFKTWINGFQDLGFRTQTDKCTQCILRSSHLFPITFLCIHRHFSLRPVVTDRLRPVVTDRRTLDLVVPMTFGHCEVPRFL
jgi:hypothetical protein